MSSKVKTKLTKAPAVIKDLVKKTIIHDEDERMEFLPKKFAAHGSILDAMNFEVHICHTANFLSHNSCVDAYWEFVALDDGFFMLYVDDVGIQCFNDDNQTSYYLDALLFSIVVNLYAFNQLACVLNEIKPRLASFYQQNYQNLHRWFMAQIDQICADDSATEQQKLSAKKVSEAVIQMLA